MPKITPLERAQLSQGNWRKSIRDLIGPRGEKLYTVLMDLAEGKPYFPTLPDGTRMTEPVVPSPEVRYRAATDLLDRVFGKAVPQTEVVKAEEQSMELEALSAMTEEELWLRLKPDFLQRISSGQVKVSAEQPDISLPDPQDLAKYK